MISREILKDILLEKPRHKKIIKRDINLVDIDKIFSIIGPRRAGKTYFLFQIIENLIEKGVEESQILYINFEDDRLSDIEKEDLQLILDTFYELFPENRNKKIYFMFDEVQNVPSWSKFIRRLQDKENCKIYLTGSSAKLLSKEIATELRGRTWSYYIYPFSFKEYLLKKEINLNKNTIYTKDKHLIINYFNKYLEQGGFPETIELGERERIILHQNYYDSVLFRDIIERYNPSNVDIIRELFKSLINNFARSFSVHKFYNNLKSQNRAISKDYLYPLVNYLEDTMYFFFVPIYSESQNIRTTNPKKVYLVDNGLIKSIISKPEEEGWLYENLVAIELLRQGKEISYFKGKGECDFISIDKIKKISMPIQVTLEPDSEREIQGLLEAMNRINVNQGTIITKAEDKTIEKEGKKIIIIPLWKWLLI